MSSATYQQSSKSLEEKYTEDPLNILLARGPRFRLSSEQIRDQALAISGLLNPMVGGKSVMPSQPDGIWQVVYNYDKWTIEEDENQYRRGLYTYWKRTSPYPAMMAFDNPSREYCVSRRIRTNTPLQALVTLNDPVFIEIANAFGDRMKKFAPNQIDEQIAYGVLLATGKKGNTTITKVLKQLYHQSVESLRASQGSSKLISDTDQTEQLNDAMSIIANAILNLDQVLTKE